MVSYCAAYPSFARHVIIHYLKGQNLKALITGAGGFVGGHLLTFLTGKPDILLYGTVLNDAEKRQALLDLYSELWTVDLCQPEAVEHMIDTIRPDTIYHLAGQSYVPRSFEAPWETIENNLRSTLNLLNAVYRLKLHTRILIVGSAEVYGIVNPADLPLTENAPLMPSSPYSVSKIAQDMLALQYTTAHNVFTIRVRPFNHIGPGQNIRFSVPNWASQIAEIERGKQDPIVYVGDLSAARDFTDVRDVVRAYAMALEYGVPGALYHVCSGRAYTMHDILETLIAMSRVPVEIRVAPERVRPIQIPVLVGDCTRLRTQTGWIPNITLEQSLHDVLDEWRQRGTDTI
jgi:GDP-4-dehydro-6-deoxy-D-mannose reductase